MTLPSEIFADVNKLHFSKIRKLWKFSPKPIISDEKWMFNSEKVNSKPLLNHFFFIFIIFSWIFIIQVAYVLASLFVVFYNVHQMASLHEPWEDDSSYVATISTAVKTIFSFL